MYRRSNEEEREKDINNRERRSMNTENKQQSKNQKYIILAESKMVDECEVYRIQSTSRFFNKSTKKWINIGDKGGYVQGEHNLSYQSDSTAWVDDNAVAMKNAKVLDHAILKEQAVITDDSKALDDTIIYGHISGTSEIKDRVRVGRGVEINNKKLGSNYLIKVTTKY